MFISFSALTLQSRHRDGFARSLRFHIDYCRVMHQQDINNYFPWSLMVSNGADAKSEIATRISNFHHFEIAFKLLCCRYLLVSWRPTNVDIVCFWNLCYKQGKPFFLYAEAFITEPILQMLKIFYLILSIINYFHECQKVHKDHNSTALKR